MQIVVAAIGAVDAGNTALSSTAHRIAPALSASEWMQQAAAVHRIAHPAIAKPGFTFGDLREEKRLRAQRPAPGADAAARRTSPTGALDLDPTRVRPEAAPPGARSSTGDAGRRREMLTAAPVFPAQLALWSIYDTCIGAAGNPLRCPELRPSPADHRPPNRGTIRRCPCCCGPAAKPRSLPECSRAALMLGLQARAWCCSARFPVARVGAARYGGPRTTPFDRLFCALLFHGARRPRTTAVDDAAAVPRLHSGARSTPVRLRSGPGPGIASAGAATGADSHWPRLRRRVIRGSTIPRPDFAGN